MDQAKFKLPRYPEGTRSKTAQAMWRPQLHVTGAIAAGLREFWFLSSCTVPGDASAQITYINEICGQAELDLAQRGRVMPAILRIGSDNTCSETKNQIMMKYLAFMVWKGMFKCGEMCQLRCGHTHNGQDRRFSVCATCLVRERADRGHGCSEGHHHQQSSPPE